MKKVALCILFVLIGVLSACTDNTQKDAYSFISDLTVDDLVSEYENEDATYSILLDTNSPKYLQIKENDHCIIVQGKEERVFVYQDENDTPSPYDVSYRYYYLKSTQELFQLDNHGTSLVVQQPTDADLFQTILNNEGEHIAYVGFATLYPVLSEMIQSVDDQDIEKVAEHNLRMISFTKTKNEILEHSSMLEQHFMSLYGTETTSTIISRIESSTHDSYHIDLYYDAIKQTLLPLFRLSFQQYEYYTIRSTVDDFQTIPECQ